ISLFGLSRDDRPPPPQERWRYRPTLECLEDRTAPALLASEVQPLPLPTPTPAPPTVLSPADVSALLQRRAAATASHDRILAVVDRGGHILGVRVEGGVSPLLTQDAATLTFAIDGAVAKARTAAFFANDTAPLTSRTIQFISQSTVTQREVESNPDVPDHN